MLQAGDLVPHFAVTNLQGETVSYSTIWQRRSLVLITVPSSDPDGTFGHYVSQLTAQGPALQRSGCEWIVTRDAVTGVPCPGVVVADRWGEIVHIAAGSEARELPLPQELVEWVTYVQHQCPECEGEAK
jgi:hypothetical protein